MASPRKALGRWLEVPSSAASRAASCCASAITDSDSDMWSVASDEDGAFGPRMDAATLWHLLRKVHAGVEDSKLQEQRVPQLELQTLSPNRLQNARDKMSDAVARLREAQMEMEEANEVERHARLTEHSPELLTCYSQRIQELEKENRALRCSLLRDNGIEGEDSLPLPRFRAGHFQINGSDDEAEVADNHHSLTGLFDIDWDHVGSKVVSCVSSRALTRRPSPDSGNDVGSDVETTTEATTAAEPPTSPQPTGSSFSAAAHFLALERLIHKLSEEDAKLIWLQFARYESEIGYLRSVISTYEDICLGGDAGERLSHRTPRTTGRMSGRSQPLNSARSVRRPRSAHRFKEALPNAATWTRAASARSCSFNSSASRRRRRARHSAAVLLQANPDVAVANLPSIESFLESLPQLGSESTTRPACERSQS